MPWMQIASSHLKGRVYTPAGPRITIGRHEDNAVCIPDSTVSGYHAVLTRDGDRYRLEDLESTNGTEVNGERVEAVLLGAVAKIRFGHIEVLFRDRAGEPAPPTAGPAAPEPGRKVVMVPVASSTARPAGPRRPSPLQIGSPAPKRREGVQTVSTGQGGNDSRKARP